MAARPEAPGEPGTRVSARRWPNLGRRLLAAALFTPLFLAIAWHGRILFVLLVNAICIVATREFYAMMEGKGARPHHLLGGLAGLLLPWCAYVQRGTYLSFALVLLLVAIMMLELFQQREQPALHIAVTALGIFYVDWLLSHLVLLRELPLVFGMSYRVGFELVVLVFLLTWMSDTGAYAVGSIAGRHKLAPRVSPGKSIEGALGGLVVAIAAGLCAALTFMRGEIEPQTGAALGALAALFGQLGDLVESLLKRDARVKDTSAAIPGHGGVLDRFDSMLFTAPLLYYALRYFVFGPS